MKSLELFILIAILAIGLSGQDETAVATASVVKPEIALPVQAGELAKERHQPVAEYDNEQELKLMTTALAGNVWLPAMDEQSYQEKNQFHDTLQQLSDKVALGASEADKTRYLEMKLVSIQDRIAMIEYFHQRVSDIKTDTGVVLLQPEVVELGYTELSELQNSIESIQAELW